MAKPSNGMITTLLVGIVIILAIAAGWWYFGVKKAEDERAAAAAASFDQALERGNRAAKSINNTLEGVKRLKGK